MRKLVYGISITLASGLLMLGSSSLFAALSLNLDTVVSGTTPAGSAPWLNATFTSLNANTIQLTMSAVNLQGSEFVSNWSFNVVSSQNINNLTFTPVISPPPSSNTVTTGTQSVSGSQTIQVDGGGKYSVQFSFPTSNGTNSRFVNGATAVVDITGANINPSIFDLSSIPGGNGSFFSIAHIQSIGPQGADSAFVGSTGAVPEPSTYLILGSMLGFVILASRKLGFKRV